jgi:toxin ParE1/3/4
MSRVVITRAAKRDLKEIGSYIARDNEIASKRWVKKLRDKCKSTIGMFPECGTQCDKLLPTMRCFSVGSYLIFFRGRNPVEILRIVHGAMDITQLKFTE